MAAVADQFAAKSCRGWTQRPIPPLVETGRGRDLPKEPGRSCHVRLIAGFGLVGNGLKPQRVLESGTAPLAIDRVPVVELQATFGTEPGRPGYRSTGKLEGYNSGRHGDNPITNDH